MQCRLDVAVAEQHASADLVGADSPAVHPVVERHERDAQAAGRLAAGQIVRCLGGGFGMELPQLVAQRFANHLRELVGGHAAQKDFLGHNDSNLVDDAKKGFPSPSRKRRMALQISANRCQPVPHRRHAVGRFRTLAFVCFGWHCRVIGFFQGEKKRAACAVLFVDVVFEPIGTFPIPPEQHLLKGKYCYR